MKDFEEYLRFISEDCKHEIEDIGKGLAYQYTDADADTIGMPQEALGMLMNIVGTVSAELALLLLRRYHEWSEWEDQKPE